MMKFKTTAFILLASFHGFSQNVPINFETGGQGANWTWTVFENGRNPALEIVTNPDATGANTSAKVAKFTALGSGQPWAGVESAQGSDLGTFVLSPTNNIITIKVWKSVISDVGIKLISSTLWSQGELKVPNTLINQWEVLTFDFSSYINPPAQNGVLNQIAIFPDFSARTEDHTIYFDDIQFNGLLSAKDHQLLNDFSVYPNPAAETWTINAHKNAAFTVFISDLRGQVVSEHMSVSGSAISIDAHTYTAGMYLARITSKKGTQILKLIKS